MADNSQAPAPELEKDKSKKFGLGEKISSKKSLKAAASGRDLADSLPSEAPAREPSASGRLGSQRLAVGAQRLDDSGRLSSMRMKKMTETVLKEPPLYLADYGQGSWQLDVFSFPHNAIRREMSDMYYLVASMQKRVLDLSHDDIDDFYDWFDIFQMFVQWYFVFEEKLLLPWVAPATELTGILSEAERKKRHESLLERLSDIDLCQDRFSHLPAGEVLPALIVALDRFSPSIIEYFGEQEKTLPFALTQLYGEEDKKKFDEVVLEYIRNSEDNHTIMHLLLRPIKSHDLTAEVRKQYLNYGGFWQRIKFKRSYEKSRPEFKQQHTEIVKQFYKRWGQAQADAVIEEQRLNDQGGVQVIATENSKKNLS
mmetsp:Transcript_5615/g.10006  ORF Transcript_5615/g.10006 Transcript_5615/m.10006 type:complete len:369 (-) Transcript_5615:531-1637(-)